VSNYLIGQVSLEEIFIKDKAFNFDILPAGTIPPNPGELIKMDKLHELLEELKQEYDYIIIDTSPIGLVSDGYTLSGMVNLMLFVVRYNKTNKKFFKNTIAQLKLDGLKMVNVILNDVDGSGGYGYNSYGSYGYGGNSRYHKFLKKRSYHTNRAGYYAGEYFDQGDEHFPNSKKKKKNYNKG
jgi:capsular exopolysaccharide synthesis family protein